MITTPRLRKLLGWGVGLVLLAWLLHAAATDHATAWDDPAPAARIFTPCHDAALTARYLRWRTALREALNA